MTTSALTARRIFDGETLRTGQAILVSRSVVEAIVNLHDLPEGAAVRDFGDAILSPGFVDVQVNGGGGVLFNDAPSKAAVETITSAHRAYGTAALLPTLITDTPDVTRQAIDAAIEAENNGVEGFAGLHLEGPHLSVKRHGAHDPGLIRPMNDDDLHMLLSAKDRLRTLVSTVAPESVTESQIRALAKAGIIVSLGHSDCSYDTAMRCFDAGATMVTHLFNAMSQLSNREPGLVGAALASGAVSAGLIADGFHVHAASMAAALRAKAGPGDVFLVTDAMSTVGSDLAEFTLKGRRILREGGRLTLEDGTLAGADIDMLSCVRNAHRMLGLPLEAALAMATSAPAKAIRRPELGRIRPGERVSLIALTPDLSAVEHVKLA
ncbi:MAG: N-acetylglucosamine-6-phosphate deacetylase [Rhizobiaceae bacterium]